MVKPIVQSFVGHLGDRGVFSDARSHCSASASQPLLDAEAIPDACGPHPRGASAREEQAMLCLTEVELQHMREIAAL